MVHNPSDITLLGIYKSAMTKSDAHSANAADLHMYARRHRNLLGGQVAQNAWNESVNEVNRAVKWEKIAREMVQELRARK